MREFRRNNSGDNSRPPRSSSSSSSVLSTTNILILISHAVTFLSGTLYGANHVFHESQTQCPECPSTMQSYLNSSKAMRRNTNSIVDCPPQEEHECPECPSQEECPECPECSSQEKQGVVKEVEIPAAMRLQGGVLPETVRRVTVGMAHTTKDEFTSKFDLGVPIDKVDGKFDRDVLFLYSSIKSMPNKMKDTKYKTIDFVTAEEATENCNVMHVLNRYRGGNKEICLALVPNYESYHLQNWMRMPEKGAGGKDYPLRLVPRTLKWDGQDEFGVPVFRRHTRQTWKDLKIYIETHEAMLKEIKEIVNRIKYKNTVVVMVCNHGQSELLMNFVCSARSRGFNLDHVLIFATDVETKAIAESMGLTAYYNEENFGGMPSEAAKEYGDLKFMKMMMAKVICVHLALLAGNVDVLFQDVDIIWYKDPLPFFHDRNSTIFHHDAIFQDDGARSLRYAPYSANSGFYYLRNNVRTQNFMTQLIQAGDLIFKSYSHQQAMIAIISEQMSLHGLKVKVLSKDLDDFPGGFHFHRAEYFKQFFQGKKDPTIFHMSWTLNKDNKLLFFKQLGEWYVKEDCVSQRIDNITMSGGTAVEACCSAEALFSCHYKDKPSKFPCNDSPAIDRGGKNFWGGT